MVDLFPCCVPAAKRRMVISQAVHRHRQIHPHRLGVGPGARSPLGQGSRVVGQARLQSVFVNPFPGLGHQVGERGEGQELAGGEEVGKAPQAINPRSHVPTVLRKLKIRLPGGQDVLGENLVLRVRGVVAAPSRLFGHDCHEPSPHVPGLALLPHVLQGDGGAADEALRPPAVHRALPGRGARSGFHAEHHPPPLHLWDHVGLLPPLLGEPEGAHQGRLGPAGGVRAGHGAGPEPGDDGLAV